MGIGKMNVPLFISTLPEGMTFTVNSIDANTPSGMYTYNQYKIGLPHTFTSAEITAGIPNNKRGAKIAELLMQADGAFDSGPGGSFLLKFRIGGRPTTNPEMAEANISGTLTVGTSDWNTFSRPDQTHITWQLDNISPLAGPNGIPSSSHGEYSVTTTGLAYLMDTCVVVTAIPEKNAYAFGVCNKQDFLVKVLQGGVTVIMAGHVLVWGIAGGWVVAIGEAAVGVVVWAAGAADVVHL